MVHTTKIKLQVQYHRAHLSLCFAQDGSLSLLKVALQWKPEVNNEIHLLCMLFTVEPATIDPCGLLLTREVTYSSVN